MKIAALETLHCDAGTRNFDVLKLMTDTGLVGWSEYKNPRTYAPGFARATEGFSELNADRYVLNGIRDQLAAFREGTGPDMDILVDLNFNYKTEGYVKIAHAGAGWGTGINEATVRAHPPGPR